MKSCDLCGKEFAFNCLLVKHLGRKKPCVPVETVDNKYTCEKCEIVFSNESECKTHESSCNPLQCPDCMKEFISMRSRRKHSCNQNNMPVVVERNNSITNTNTRITNNFIINISGDTYNHMSHGEIAGIKLEKCKDCRVPFTLIFNDTRKNKLDKTEGTRSVYYSHNRITEY